MSFGIPVRNGLAIGLLSSTTLSSNGGLFPAMALDFLQPYLDSRVTFTRGSNATLVDSTGKITYAPANLLLQSQTFETSPWFVNNATITSNTAVAPDGTVTADKLVEDATNNFHRVGQVATISANTHTATVYAKPAGRDWLYFANASLSRGAYFNVSTGVIGLIVGATTATITSAGNGWYRCSITSDTNAGGQNYSCYTANADSSFSYAGDGVSGLFLWGAQLEPVTYQTTPSTYVATTTAAYYGPRFDYDPVTLAPKGILIEEQRTNLVLYSEQFNNTSGWTATGATVSANTTSSPDGTVNADSLVEDTSTGVHRVFATPSCSVSTAYTYTAYIKAAGRTEVRLLETTLGGAIFNLSAITIIATDAGVTASIQDAGNGWRRCRITATTGVAQVLFVAQIQASAAGSTSYTGNGTTALFMWGAQLEAGSFATSYIPTVASQVTRSADIATMTGTNFSSWYNQTQGTFVMNFTPDGGLVSASTRVLSTTSGGVSNRVVDVNFSGGSWTNYNGTATTTIGAATVTTTPQRIAIAYATANYGYTLNGGTVVADTSALVNSPTQLNLGYLDAGNFLNGHIRQIAYFNTRLTNTQLQQLTAPPLVTTLSLDFINGVYNA